MQLSNFIRRVIFSTAFISTFLVFSISIIFQYINFRNDKVHIKEEFTQIKKEQIMEDSRKNIKSEEEAFSKDGFDKAKYIQIMSEKRDNMLKSQAEVIEKSYAILTTKQKEQLKVLMDLRKEKIKG